ncbi:MAG TPA: hypothetical protein P5295_17965 [Spirochaetota bacterium]|nr:hypothetical protein [Spirochaetota bacterium]
MGSGTICLIALSIVFLAALLWFFGIFFVMMRVIDGSVNREPYERTQIKLRIVKSAGETPLYPGQKTCPDEACGNVRLA